MLGGVACLGSDEHVVEDLDWRRAFSATSNG